MTHRLVHMGRTLQSRIRDFFDSPIDASATPLEIVQAVLDVLERKVQPLGRGHRVFPYNRITVRLGPAFADRPALQAAFNGLEGRLRERLTELRCSIPPHTDVRVSFLRRAPAEWTLGQLFSVECEAEAEAVPEPQPAPREPTLQLTIVKGAASKKAYTFAQPVVSIGRTAEPTDERGRVRRNDVVFLDTVDETTETVGRAHARLEFEARTRTYRLYNEGSSNPTFIARGGTTIQVAPRDPRGVRVRSGDEIHLGRAVIRVAVGQ
ncbi:MAG: FHA domain-containing protein [Vicinamibacterales bacterium]